MRKPEPVEIINLECETQEQAEAAEPAPVTMVLSLDEQSDVKAEAATTGKEIPSGSTPKGDARDSFVVEGSQPVPFPCHACQAEVISGQHCCVKCGVTLKKSAAYDRKFLDLAKSRNRILEKVTKSTQKALQDLTEADFSRLTQRMKRGAVSLEADALRNGKEARNRALKLGFESVADRFLRDTWFASEQSSHGRTVNDMRRYDLLAVSFLPDPGRTRTQRVIGAGAQFLLEQEPSRAWSEAPVH